MSAKIYAPPAALGDGPQFDPKIPIQQYFDMEEAYVERVKQYARNYKPDPSGCAGEELRFPVADGYARYIVLSLRPAQLIELKLGDGWQFQFAHLLTAAEIKKMVGQNRKRNVLFGKSV